MKQGASTSTCPSAQRARCASFQKKFAHPSELEEAYKNMIYHTREKLQTRLSARKVYQLELIQDIICCLSCLNDKQQIISRFPPNDNAILTAYTLHFHKSNGILSNRNVVLDSSAWAGQEVDAPVDEVEAVRIVSGEPPGLITILRRERPKLVSNDHNKTFSVM